MSEMIERVAKAMFFAMHPDAEWSRGRARMKWYAMAEEAIEAMREPTERMLKAGCLAANKDALEDWQAMIDEALR